MRDRFFGEPAPVENVANLDSFKAFGILFAAFSMHLDAILGNLLAFLAQDVDDVRAGASAESNQQKFERTRRIGSLSSHVERKRVSAGRNRDKEIVAGIANGGFGIFHLFMVRVERSTLIVHG